MTAAAVQSCLEKLGYAAEPDVLHLRGEAIPETHPYALEIKTLLKPDGAVRAQAVFDVEGVPTVVFVADDEAPLTTAQLDQTRQRIWNQNLATIVIELKGNDAAGVGVSGAAYRECSAARTDLAAVPRLRQAGRSRPAESRDGDRGRSAARRSREPPRGHQAISTCAQARARAAFPKAR